MFNETENNEVASSASEPTGIGSLRLKPQSVPAPAQGNSQPTLTKGGKGGEGGQPPLPPSTAAFLEGVVRGVADGAGPAVCSKPGDPNDGGWRAEPVIDLDAQCPPDRNNYFNCSSFVLDDDNTIQARKEKFSAYHVLVLDDVGTKIDPAKLAGFIPTWEIETSPGNSQIGIRLATPLRDPAQVKKLQDAVVAAGLSDPGASGLARWVRLPGAINGKAKYRTEDGKPFNCRVVQWRPDTAYTVDELAAFLSLKLEPVPPASVKREGHVAVMGGDNVFTPAPGENPVLSALRERGLLKQKLAPGKFDITCPWIGEHTDDLDSGTAYFETDATYANGGFCCQHSHGDKLHIAQLLDFLSIKPDRARGKARIDIVAGEMNRVRKAAEHSLALHGGFFQAGGTIVVIRTDPGTGDVRTEMLGEPQLAAALADAADWYRYDGRSSASVRCDPPPRNVTTLLKAREYDYLPVLTGLARQPHFREGGGELVTKPGYDEKSGRFGAFDPAQFPLPEPTEAAARSSLAELDGLLDEFAFATPEDRSAAICAMLTGSVRPGLPTAPAFNITASTPGSGKSYLASTIVPFTGPGGALKVSYPTTADEATKVMLSIFMSAPAAVLFDDMQGQWIAFGAINRALTSDTVTDRVLGESRTVTVGTRSLIMGTGNNVGPVRDMMRRVVTIRLHHKTATPALLSYEGRPAEQVIKHRGKYVAAALTIIAAWRAAGSPMAEVPSIASYGEWSDMCRQPLLWLGLPDPAASIIEQLTHDPDQDDLGRLLKTWHAAIGDKPVTLRDVIDLSINDEDLNDALLDLPVVERDVINRSKLGWYLKKNANRVVGGLELQTAQCSSRNGWRVVVVEQAESVTG